MNYKQAIETIEKVGVGPIFNILLKNEFKPISQADYFTAYTAVFKSSEGEKDAKYIFEYFMKVMTEYVETIYKKVSDLESEALIDGFIKETSNWKILSNWTNKIFNYLDRIYTKEKCANKKLFWQCMNIYKKNFLIPLKEKFYSELNKIITNDRLNLVVDRNKIKYVIDVLEYVDIENPMLVKRGDDYFWIADTTLTKQIEDENKKRTLKEWFQTSFGPATKSFILNKFNILKSANSTIEYVNMALKYLEEEDLRKIDYIKHDLIERLDNLNLKFIVDEQAKTLSVKDTGFRYMFNNEKLEELAKSFKLFNLSGKRETYKIMTDIMEEYIRDEGEKIFLNQDLRKDPIKFIPELLKFKKKMDKLVEEKFDNHLLFQDSKNKAFSQFMNREIYSKFLAIFSDYEMKIGVKGLSEKAYEEKINDIVNLFRCLNNKLIFQIEYVKKLSDRLIQGKSQNLIAEKMLITKLKAEVGVTYVNKMTSMLQDLDSSKAEIDLYRTQTHRGSPQGIHFNVQILQNGAWEIDKSKFDKLELPKYLNNCMEDFNKFYTTRHKTHKLTWAFNLGSLEIEYLYLSKRYQSVSTLMQLLVLLALEKYETLKVGKIMEIIGSKDNLIVISEINALIYHPAFNPRKLKTGGVILIEEDENQEVTLNSVIKVNKSFQANNLRINTIPALYKKPPGSDSEQEKQDAINLRTYRNILIDSTLTRIMKSRIGKKTTHTQLVTDVAKQIELFQAQPPQIKERIEALIEKNILKRSENDITSYEYVA